MEHPGIGQGLEEVPRKLARGVDLVGGRSNHRSELAGGVER